MLTDYTPILTQNALFRGMTDAEITAAATALSATEKRYAKGDYILHAGDTTSRLGMILSGSVTIESNDIWGNSTILSHVGTGGLFAETYSLLPEQVLLVDVVANDDCRILFLDMRALQSQAAAPRTANSDSSTWHPKLTANLLQISIRKNLLLSNRSFQTAPKTIRGKVLAYLSDIAERTGKKEFDIPFDRQQLADYLGVDRSALSAELSRMQKAGLIETHRSHFVLK
jgi:CRP-like cAMP-binding protein